ncbi:MAG TPA: AsnC family transcriptional regulator [Deltaproteobacteria bacterium]|nr:AsnC family transcriptional regulator [Deltaproteobacteria bacterium]HXK46193.1 AsnC family transcriptional regulator [Deltaproteobacteria bacterium]
MDHVDRAILSIVNKALPLSERPFSEVARHAGITEDEVIARIGSMKEQGVIRRIGAVVDPRKLGWSSTLCAADIPEGRIGDFHTLARRFREITHNYVRDGKPNCWFTIIAPDRRRTEDIMNEIGQALDTTVLDLPARKIFKIRVAFDLE